MSSISGNEPAVPESPDVRLSFRRMWEDYLQRQGREPCKRREIVMLLLLCFPAMPLCIMRNGISMAEHERALVLDA